jgi:hypothetical protein
MSQLVKNLLERKIIKKDPFGMGLYTYEVSCKNCERSTYIVNITEYMIESGTIIPHRCTECQALNDVIVPKGFDE